MFVDPLIPSPTWKWPKACHMVSNESLEELHGFAKRLGLKRSWFQDRGNGRPHYDLNEDKRKLAVRLGAMQLTRNEFVTKMKAGDFDHAK